MIKTRRRIKHQRTIRIPYIHIHAYKTTLFLGTILRTHLSYDNTCDYVQTLQNSPTSIPFHTFWCHVHWSANKGTDALPLPSVHRPSRNTFIRIESNHCRCNKNIQYNISVRNQHNRLQDIKKQQSINPCR